MEAKYFSTLGATHPFGWCALTMPSLWLFVKQFGAKPKKPMGRVPLANVFALFFCFVFGIKPSNCLMLKPPHVSNSHFVLCQIQAKSWWNSWHFQVREDFLSVVLNGWSCAKTHQATSVGEVWVSHQEKCSSVDSTMMGMSRLLLWMSDESRGVVGLKGLLLFLTLKVRLFVKAATFGPVKVFLCPYPHCYVPTRNPWDRIEAIIALCYWARHGTWHVGRCSENPACCCRKIIQILTS